MKFKKEKVTEKISSEDPSKKWPKPKIDSLSMYQENASNILTETDQIVMLYSMKLQKIIFSNKKAKTFLEDLRS